ncbi:serine/threonine-protein kinase [Kitasatospora sp. NPDC050543]|uniref:serine/threonine-protein kinase n=1 Tax=Kitasatospora sp. NPDC050543 TaxID=3364054 RepID=UPI0037A3F8C7
MPGVPAPDDVPVPEAAGRPPLDVPTGYLVAGRRITGLIGSGGWGSVYAAEDVDGGAPVAVKFLRPGLLTPGQRRTMAELVRRELDFSRQADHPQLIRTLAAVTVCDPERPRLDGAVALVMERAERSLQQLLEEGEAGTPVPEAARILAEVCAGLAHMHGTGWVHGDLKPANILLMPGGAVRLADFGLTAELEGTHAYAPPLGSLDHVPPEWWSQRAGARGVQLRPSADIWAFGVLAHQVLTGGLHPFLGATARARSLAAQAYARGAAPLRLDERLPGGWRALISVCLAADRAERAALDATGLLSRVRAAGGPPARPARCGHRPHRGLVLAGAGLAVAAAVALCAAFWAGWPDATGAHPRPPAPPAATASAPAGAATGPSPSPSAPPSGVLRGAIVAGSDVPAALLEPIDRAARRCPEPEVTPALLAAMLKAESGFDPDAARPQSQEYGIAMWTPAVFNAWAQDGDNDGRKDYMSPPDAIITMGSYACWLDQQFKHRGITADLPALIAAGYRTSDKTVAAAGGVPERVRPHVDAVLRYLAQYTG